VFHVAGLFNFSVNRPLQNNTKSFKSKILYYLFSVYNIASSIMTSVYLLSVTHYSLFCTFFFSFLHTFDIAEFNLEALLLVVSCFYYKQLFLSAPLRFNCFFFQLYFLPAYTVFFSANYTF